MHDIGLTMRDYFAAAALTGLLAYAHPDNDGEQMDSDEAAEEAYEFADAMMEARKATGQA